MSKAITASVDLTNPKFELLTLHNFREWRPKMENTARTTFGNAGHIIKTLKELEFPDPERPTPVVGPFSSEGSVPKTDEFELVKYQELLKEVLASKKKYKEDKSKLFALILLHMSRHSQTLVENKPDYAGFETNSDAIGLMKLITSTHQVYYGLDHQSRITTLTRELIGIRQQESQATTDYVQAYRDRITKCRDAGVPFAANESFYVSTFLLSLNSSNRVFVDRILDPTMNSGTKPPATLDEAMNLIDEHIAYLQSSGQLPTTKRSSKNDTPSAVVAVSTVSNHGKQKGKSKSNAAGGRPKCIHCGRFHLSEMCFSLPENADKKLAHEAKLKKNKDKQKAVLITLIEEVLNK